LDILAGPARFGAHETVNLLRRGPIAELALGFFAC
jgi:hypothetical protein